METIYYLSTIIFIWSEMIWLISPIEKTINTKKFHELNKQFKGKKWDEFSEEYKSELKSKIWMLWVFLWVLIGLFTTQWIVFLILLIFNIIIIGPLSKLTRYNILYTIIHWVNSLIGFCFGLFIIINHYHLKIDLTQLFLSLI
jgi:hypothetical protein